MIKICEFAPANAGGHNSPGAELLRTCRFFNIVHLLPKDLRCEHVGAKLASCPGLYPASLRF